MNSCKKQQKESTMFKKQQKQTKEKLQGKLSQFLGKFRSQMTLPEYKSYSMPVWELLRADR